MYDIVKLMRLIMRYLIINADDFGMSQEINSGIIQAWKNGLITSASIMPTEPGYPDAIKQYQTLSKGFPIGVHLSLSGGKPSSNLANSSFSNNNQFTINEFNMKIISKIQPHELEIEFEAQIEKVLQDNLNPTHLDNHMFFIYLNPYCFEKVIHLAAKYNLPLRWPFTIGQNDLLADFQKNLNLDPSLVKELLMLYNELKNKYKIKTTNNYFQLPHRGNFEEKKSAFTKIIQNFSNGISELCVHPGFGSENRENELKILNNEQIRQMIQDESIKLCNYRILEN